MAALMEELGMVRKAFTTSGTAPSRGDTVVGGPKGDGAMGGSFASEGSAQMRCKWRLKDDTSAEVFRCQVFIGSDVERSAYCVARQFRGMYSATRTSLLNWRRRPVLGRSLRGWQTERDGWTRSERSDAGADDGAECAESAEAACAGMRTSAGSASLPSGVCGGGGIRVSVRSSSLASSEGESESPPERGSCALPCIRLDNSCIRFAFESWGSCCLVPTK
eukprot:6173922-Pleurochrysis_carterae.AAC.4